MDDKQDKSSMGSSSAALNRQMNALVDDLCSSKKGSQGVSGQGSSDKSQNASNFDGLSNKVGSYGMLCYDSGDIYEG